MMRSFYEDDVTALKIAAAVGQMKETAGEGCKPVVYIAQGALPNIIELNGAPVKRSWAVKPGQVFLIDMDGLEADPFPLGGPPVGPV